MKGVTVARPSPVSDIVPTVSVQCYYRPEHPTACAECCARVTETCLVESPEAHYRRCRRESATRAGRRKDAAKRNSTAARRTGCRRSPVL